MPHMEFSFVRRCWSEEYESMSWIALGCFPKVAEGVGIIDPKMKNRALLAKLFLRGLFLGMARQKAEGIPR